MPPLCRQGSEDTLRALSSGRTFQCKIIPKTPVESRIHLLRRFRLIKPTKKVTMLLNTLAYQPRRSLSR